MENLIELNEIEMLNTSGVTEWWELALFVCPVLGAFHFGIKHGYQNASNQC